MNVDTSAGFQGVDQMSKNQEPEKEENPKYR